ncbi:UDP-glucose:glycoprotein glucosyltransferase-domain-containing protein [Limtongia smithiae]|uniref:UDP-glucose:glycoprotein glucosyltransferase-domain-containing protein n=1 Tax=Limtongia smithiae TaxID=1125753 RepID=UPI0034CE40FA
MLCSLRASVLLAGATIFLLLGPVLAATPALHLDLSIPWAEHSPYLLELVETVADENPNAYFPLLAHLAEFSFYGDAEDKLPPTHSQLYDEALSFTISSGFLSKGPQTDWFDLKLSLRKSAPRIQAYYQFYNASVFPVFADSLGKCANDSWFLFNGKPSCDPSALFALQIPATVENSDALPFDRSIGPATAPTVVLYADLASPSFLLFHSTLIAEAKHGKIKYVVRYKPSVPVLGSAFAERPKGLSAYGVELALKRTDYIVIDDRAAYSKKQTVLDDGDIRNVVPLKTTEIANISTKAAAYILKNTAGIEPIDALLTATQDFPKLASAIAATSLDGLDEFYEEATENFRVMGRTSVHVHGYNSMYVNGARLDSQFSDDFFAFEEIIDRERKILQNFADLNLSNSEISQFISSSKILALKSVDPEPRFNYFDDEEGGNLIFWLNDFETDDPTYAKFSPSINTILKPHYPGQFHRIRRNIHTLVVPVDLSRDEDIFLVLMNLKTFVTRGIPIRIGVIPLCDTPGQIIRALSFYYTSHHFGADSMYKILEALRGQQPEDDRTEMVESELDTIERAQLWSKRMGVTTEKPIVFCNGFVLSRESSGWLQAAALRLDADVLVVQDLLRAGEIQNDTNIPELLLRSAAPRRNGLICPEDFNAIEQINLIPIFKSYSVVLDSLPSIEIKAAEASKSGYTFYTTLLIAADFDSKDGIDLFKETLDFLSDEWSHNILMRFLHIPGLEKNTPTLSTLLHFLDKTGALSEISPERLLEAFGDAPEATEDYEKIPHVESVMHLLSDAKTEGWAGPDNANAFKFWESTAALVSELGVKVGESLVLFNGRAVRFHAGQLMTSLDFESLLKYEEPLRVLPASAIANDLGLFENLPAGTSPYDFAAQLISASAQADDIDISGGFFHQVQKRSVEIGTFKNEHSGFDVGGVFDDAELKIIATIDPVSEFAQKYVPMLKVLSEVDGVVVRIILNPTVEVTELPIKRFYRLVLSSKTAFAEDGGIIAPETVFEGMPSDTLLTLAMDVPSSWLVTPSKSKYDLDNIILSNVAEDKVEAEYLLEHIMVEGHVRDMSFGEIPPAGLQMTLGSELNPSISDTIVMANLGYMQFKSEPGVWTLGLRPGPSDIIFHIDSAGAHGFIPQAIDVDNRHVDVISFRGARIYPRVSRNKGKEHMSLYEEVVEVMGPIGISENIKFFIRNTHRRIKAMLEGRDTKSKTVKYVEEPKPQAAINIFSVASGHLYERFLNIMFVSVMRHTNETVKFWLIENFLSPSFKEFLPHMAEQYKFQYELITYKWPHWLRPQTEKQRIIWAYKILFLDVMFPLDLQKVIFVDADQIVRTDLKELVDIDLHGAPYGYTPMCDSRKEIDGYRFWKTGFWKNYLQGQTYHISALYVVDLKRFRQLATGDRLRQNYHQLSADPDSLSNLDQDLPNSMQTTIPIFSLPQDWLWCETWCSDESLKTAKTIDLCNNPMTKEPKLDRARRQLPEWTVYDEEIAAFARRVSGTGSTAVEEKVITSSSETPVVVTIEAETKGAGHDEL